jgi:hypothetical protein
MFLEGEYFKLSCDAAYSDHLPFFAIAFEAATGALPYKITAIDDNYQLPEDRQDLWGEIRNIERIVPQIREEAIPLN